MKRAFVFLVAGPTLVVAVWLLFLAASRGGGHGLPGIDAMILFVFTFLVSVIIAPIDGYLARVLQTPLRTPLIAIAGAAIAVGVLHVLAGMISPHWVLLPLWILPPFAIGGAICMGMCSLLSRNYGNTHRNTTEQL